MTRTLAMPLLYPQWRRDARPIECRASRALAGRSLTRPGVAVELVADRQRPAAQARRVLLEQIAPRRHQLAGIILLYLLLHGAGCRCRQRQAGVDGMRAQGGHPGALLGRDGARYPR